MNAGSRRIRRSESRTSCPNVSMVTAASSDRAWDRRTWAGTRGGIGAKLVVPGFVPIDLAEPVCGAVSGQPRRGPGRADVDRISRYVGGRVRRRHPPRRRAGRAVLRHRLPAQPLLVCRRAPAAVDHDLDPVPGGVLRGPEQRPAQVRIEPGHGGTARVEHRHAASQGGRRQRRASEVAGEDAGEHRRGERQAARRIGRTRRAACRAGALEAMPPFKTAWRCRRVCGFRYADDMSCLVASRVHACLDRRG